MANPLTTSCVVAAPTSNDEFRSITVVKAEDRLISQLYPPAPVTCDHEIVAGIVTLAALAGAVCVGAGGGTACAMPAVQPSVGTATTVTSAAAIVVRIRFKRICRPFSALVPV